MYSMLTKNELPYIHLGGSDLQGACLLGFLLDLGKRSLAGSTVHNLALQLEENKGGADL